MAEHMSHYFKMLIAEVAKLRIPAEIRDDILAKLEFLKTESLCDFDRRKPASALREVWKNVDRQMAQHGLYNQYRPSKTMWETIGMFVEIGMFRPAPTERVARTTGGTLTPDFSFSIPDLLNQIQRECRSISTPLERTRSEQSLRYLEEESRRPLPMRNQKEILATWKRIHPDLKKHAVLKKFEGEPMKTKLIDFIGGVR
ncbi:hypothetical protein BH10BDE1_BH10BDE1_10740 [soil metagenome]